MIALDEIAVLARAVAVLAASHVQWSTTGAWAEPRWVPGTAFSLPTYLAGALAALACLSAMRAGRTANPSASAEETTAKPAEALYTHLGCTTSRRWAQSTPAALLHESKWLVPTWAAVALFDLPAGIALRAATAAGLAPFLATAVAFVSQEYARRLSHAAYPRVTCRTTARRKTYPPPYPNGWFCLVKSEQLVAGGDTVPAEALGRQFVLWRGTSGIVGCLDAHCPHLGAHMGVGGKVKGDNVECPFHKWQFRADGQCAAIPYSPGTNCSAKTKAYHVTEWYGNVCVWFHADGLDPSYCLPPIAALSDSPSGSVRFCGEMEAHVNMHIAEFADNSADFAHFQPLHGEMVRPFFGGQIFPGLTVIHEPGWSCGAMKGEPEHLAWFGKCCVVAPASPWRRRCGRPPRPRPPNTPLPPPTDDHATVALCGRPIPGSDAHAQITFVGPASCVYFRFETPIGSITLFHMHTPVLPTRQKVTFRWYADRSMPEALVWYVVGNWIAQWRADIDIWENKVYRPTPLLVRGDGPLPRMRKWFRQFYSEGSEAAGADLDW